MMGPKLQQQERQTENKTVVHFVTSLHDCDVPNFHIRVLACENIRFSSFFFDEDVSRNVLGGEDRGETDVFAG